MPSGTFSFVSSGHVAASELDMLVRPKATTLKRGVLYVHGVEAANGGGAEWEKFSERSALISSLVLAGFEIASADLGGNSTWGNATVLSRISAARDYLLTQGVLPNKIAIVATSMGALNALCWIAVNPSLVSCFVGMLPVVNLTDVHANNRGGFQPAINAAYGGSYSEALYGATHNPATMAASGKYAGVPIQFWYGSTDSIVIPSTVAAFQAAAGALCTTTQIVGGHAESTYGGVLCTSVASFIESF